MSPLEEAFARGAIDTCIQQTKAGADEVLQALDVLEPIPTHSEAESNDKFKLEVLLLRLYVRLGRMLFVLERGRPQL